MQVKIENQCYVYVFPKRGHRNGLVALHYNIPKPWPHVQGSASFSLYVTNSATYPAFISLRSYPQLLTTAATMLRRAPPGGASTVSFGNEEGPLSPGKSPLSPGKAAAPAPAAAAPAPAAPEPVAEAPVAQEPVVEEPSGPSVEALKLQVCYNLYNAADMTLGRSCSRPAVNRGSTISQWFDTSHDMVLLASCTTPPLLQAIGAIAAAKDEATVKDALIDLIKVMPLGQGGGSLATSNSSTVWPVSHLCERSFSLGEVWC